MFSNARRRTCPGEMHRGHPAPLTPEANGGNGNTPPARKGSGWRRAGIFVAVLAGVCGLVWFMPRPGERARGSGLGRSFDFNMDEYLKIDPKLMVCDEQEPIPVPFSTPRGVAVGPDDRVYVCGDRAVLVYGLDGRPGTPIDVGGDAQCLTVDSEGVVYVGVGDHVVLCPPAGERVEWESVAEKAAVVSVAVCGDRVYVADAGNSAVHVCDRVGRPVQKLGGFVLFSSPHLDVAVGPGSLVWIVNPGARELRQYDGDGNVVTSWQRVSRRIEGFSGCCNPMHIAILRDGNIVTSEKNILRVKILTPKGDLVGVVAGPDRFHESVKSLDLAVDSRGRILVLDDHRRAVRVFSRREGRSP